MAGKAQQLVDQTEQLPDKRAVWIKARFLYSCSADLPAIPPLHGTRHTIYLQVGQPQRPADIAYCATGAISNDRRSQGCSAATVLGVDVLDNFFAAFMFKINIDVRRFIAFFGDEALDQHI